MGVEKTQFGNARFCSSLSRLLLSLLGLLGLLGLLPEGLWACASCGSGGKTPLVLYPNEDRKVYLGLNYSDRAQDFDIAGERFASYGPAIQREWGVAAAQRLFRRSFVAIYLPYKQNQVGRSEQGLGDPRLSLHLLPVLQRFDRAWQPQIQVILAHKPRFARGISDSEQERMLDALGSGYTESSISLDLWYGMGVYKFGVAQSLDYLFSRTIDGVRTQPGYRATSTMSFGREHSTFGKILFGIHRYYQQAQTLDEAKVAGSEKLNHGWFVTADAKVFGDGLVTATYLERGTIFWNRNGFQNRQWTLGWAWLI